jgi:two-component system, NtrC family, response regulator AtoC
MHGRILIVDDDQSLCETIEAALGHAGYQSAYRTSADEALALLDQQDFDAVITDLNMEGMNGLALCERIVSNRPDVPVVVMTAFGSMETAVAAIRAGAYDFISKPFEIEELKLTLDHAVQNRKLREEVKRLRDEVGRGTLAKDIIGTSPAMMKVWDLVDRVAETDATVLITGDSGTGKELVAHALHNRSRRASGPFVAINCAAMPEALLESELFGHVRGAFTDAKSARRGLFLQANGGTMFLDEIGELPLGMQPKLLRALQDKVVRPVGGDHEESYDARIVAATNRDLEQDVEERRFREDLFYRINVVHIPVPPLRARGNDVLLLAQHFVRQFSDQLGKNIVGITSPVGEKLLAYRWPGNVRELQNCIERAVALTRYEELTVQDLPEKIRDYRDPPLFIPGEDPVELLPMDEIERRHILRVLKAVGGNKTTAAEVLGFDRRTLYRKLERYGDSPALSAREPRELKTI